MYANKHQVFNLREYWDIKYFKKVTIYNVTQKHKYINRNKSY